MKIIGKGFRCFMISFILTSVLLSNCKIWDDSNADGLTEHRMLFEVLNNPFGPIYPPEKTLTLRVFDNADVEFDYYLPYGPDRVGIPFRSEIKSANITQDQLNEFKSLLKQLDKASSIKNYDPTTLIFDSKITITVNYQSKEGIKQIVINENDSHMHLEKTNIYPPALINLMKLVEEVSHEKLKEARGQNGISK